MQTPHPTATARTMPRRRATLAAAAALAVSTALAPTADAALNAYMRLTSTGGTVPGESTHPGHEGWIEVRAIAAGGRQHEATTSLRTRVPHLDDFVVVKELDKSTPKLQEALFTGEVMPELRIEFPVDSLYPGLVILLHEVAVSGYRTESPQGGPGRPTESVTFNFTKVTYRYREDPNGGAASMTSFDFLFGTTEPGRDDDNDGIENIHDPDDDNDGVDDDYELRHGMHPLVADSEFDDDFDGDSNLKEWLTGSAADDGSSQFGIQSMTRHQDGRLTMMVPTVGGRSYRVKSSFDLRGGGWMTLSEFHTEPGSPPETVELELPAGAAAQFDRLFFAVDVRALEPAAQQ